jgi:polysaccharide export outer membrane protein
MFRLTDRQGRLLDSTKLRIAVPHRKRNYQFNNDFLEVRVNTNKGD